jgi:hypothetical protein
MKRVTRVAFGLAGAVAAAGLGLGVFIGSGSSICGNGQNLSTHGLSSISHVQALRGCRRTWR